jgi:hypothetical protein
MGFNRCSLAQLITAAQFDTQSSWSRGIQPTAETREIQRPKNEKGWSDGLETLIHEIAPSYPSYNVPNEHKQRHVRLYGWKGQ